MVFLDGPIPVDQHLNMAAKPVSSTDHFPKSKPINHLHRNRRTQSPDCGHAHFAIIDVITVITVISASCFLFYPYARILARKSLEIGGEVVELLTEEISRAPMVYGCLGLSIFFTSMALVVVFVCADSRCGRPGCRGLRKAPEFDIQLDTEENVKKSMEKYGLQKKVLHEVRHKELEAELKKMAPPNGRAVLVFRGSCGCSVGRMEVHGPRRCRKFKK